MRTPARKWLWLAASAWPLVYLAFYPWLAGGIAQHVRQHYGFQLRTFATLGTYALYFLTLALILFLFGYYILRAARNPRSSRRTKVLAGLAIVLFWPFSFLVCWHRYIWREPRADIGPGRNLH